MLNPWLLGLARAWAPRITLPFSMFIGYVGEVPVLKIEFGPPHADFGPPKKRVNRHKQQTT